MHWDTGVLATAVPGTHLSFRKIVEIGDARWLQLFFSKDSILGTGATIRITSLSDDEYQELDADGLDMWSHHSLYFNGESVLVEIFVAGNGDSSRLKLESVLIQYKNPAQHVGFCGICGTDDRTPDGTEDWNGRILDTGCTGNIYNEQSCMTSAGHCFAPGQTIQFRVPPSNDDCSLNHPPALDQFPVIDGGSFDRNGLGDDWWVSRVGVNGLGQTPVDRYGVFKPFKVGPADAGEAVNLWGFGVDDECTRSQVQQNSNGGTIDYRSNTHYEFSVDLASGNSGSALIHTATDTIIGIATHCSVATSCENGATRHDNGDFANARDQLCPENDGDDGKCPDDCLAPFNYGEGSRGWGGIIPEIRWDTTSGCAYLGNPAFGVDISSMYGGIPGTLIIGFRPDCDTSFGWKRLVDVIGPPAAFVKFVSYGGSGVGNGSLSLSIMIPDEPILDGLQVYMQATGFDFGAPTNVSATDGLCFQICD